MTTDSKIAWTDHTWNCWWGCTKVHAGCVNCYAENTDHRWGGGHWGPNAPRRLIKGEWTKPDRWNREARAAGRPARVFASSMCDVFEKFDGSVVDVRGVVQAGVTLAQLRARMWPIMERSTWLRWLLLTKRPENIMGMVPESWRARGGWPEHVWTGTSPCDQRTADKCIPALLRVPGRHFLSCEPMLGAVDLEKAGAVWPGACGCTEPDCRGPLPDPVCRGTGAVSAIDWVIIGGESEQHGECRGFPVEAARVLSAQCVAAGVPVFWKQFGSLPRGLGMAGVQVPFTVDGQPLRAHKGEDPAEWPPWAVQQVPQDLVLVAE